MATITLRSIKESPLTIEEMDDNFTALNTDIGNRVLASAYTAADVLTKLKTVDGSGSGLDADLLDGLNSASSNTTNSIVARDSSGNFSANQVTATLIGSVVVPTTGNISIAGSSSGSVTLNVPASAGSNTLIFPAVSGNVVTTGDTGTVTNTMLAGSIANSKLANSTITIDGNAVSLGGSVSISSGNITWTGAQTFRDNKFTITDDSDTSKAFVFEVSGVAANTTRTLTVPNQDGTIAVQSYVQSYVQTAGQNSQGTKTVSSTTPTGGVDGDIWYQV